MNGQPFDNDASDSEAISDDNFRDMPVNQANERASEAEADPDPNNYRLWVSKNAKAEDLVGFSDTD